VAVVITSGALLQRIGTEIIAVGIYTVFVIIPNSFTEKTYDFYSVQ
jgi:hypothetical protein